MCSREIALQELSIPELEKKLGLPLGYINGFMQTTTYPDCPSSTKLPLFTRLFADRWNTAQVLRDWLVSRGVVLRAGRRARISAF